MSAQIVADVERSLLPLQATTLAELPKPFWDGLAFVRAEEDRQRSLRADITFGLSGDETDSRSLFRLNTGIALAKTTFPSEVNVVNRLGLQLRDGQVQEDVTNLLISYDYHTSRFVEYFAFAERFTNGFLSIQQRYQVGFGARAGPHFGRSGAWRATQTNFEALEQQLPGLASLVSAKPTADTVVRPELRPEDWTRFATTVDYLRNSFRDRQSKLFVGLAASVFAELERAELDVTRSPIIAGDGDPVTKLKVPLPGTHRYRLSLRPTARIRPSGMC